MNPLVQGHSGTARELSRNAYDTNQGTNEDNSQSDPHPGAGIFQSKTTQNSGPEMTTTDEDFAATLTVPERQPPQPDFQNCKRTSIWLVGIDMLNQQLNQQPFLYSRYNFGNDDCLVTIDDTGAHENGVFVNPTVITKVSYHGFFCKASFCNIETPQEECIVQYENLLHRS